MHVAVCIVGYRNADDIVACLGALEKSTYSDFEVQICENGGSQAYRALTEALPTQVAGGQPVTVVEAPSNLGYAGGVNVCLGNSTSADAWWILNPDTLPDATALQALVTRLQRGDCDAVSSVMFYSDNTIESFGGRWRPWAARAVSIGHGRQLDDPVDARWVSEQLSYIPGGSMFVGRKFLQTIGLLKEDYFLYCEEVEWSLRGSKHGLRLGFAPGARVRHNQGSTTGSGGAIRQRAKLPIYLDERNKLLVTRDCFPARWPVAVVTSLLFIFARYGRHLAWAQLKYALEGWRAALGNERGVPSWFDSDPNEMRGTA